jgi:hypothetical protein
MGKEGREHTQSLILLSLICSKTSGQTAAWHFLYSSRHSGFRYSHWPIRRGPWAVEDMVVISEVEERMEMDVGDGKARV